MYAFLIAASTLQLAAIVVLAIAFVSKAKQLKAANGELSQCQLDLQVFSGIPDAEAHIESQQARLREIETLSEECRTRIESHNAEKTKLESLIQQYRSAVGNFKSVAELQSRLKTLEKTVGMYESSAELAARLDDQKRELQTYAAALKVAPEANEILGKVRYYENLVSELKLEVEAIEETRDLQHFGVYRPRYDFDQSAKYKAALDEVVDERKQMIKAGQAVEIPPGITVAGDERAGQKLGQEYAKVMLRAFNGEADANILKAKYNNMEMLQKRMVKSREAINKLGQTMQILISEDYLNLRIQELRLAYEWERKKQQEKEEQAYLKELAREEEKARKEAEKREREAAAAEKKEQERLAEKERMLEELRKEFELKKRDLEGHVVMSKKEQEELKAQLESQEQDIQELEGQRDTLITAVQEAHEKRKAAISLAQMTKRGHVYILSNIGSFGEGWFKIGMTRRDDPNVRVRELASASVPFPFDIHAMVLTNDAPGLENKLHTYFADRRVNKVNPRKEFFEVTIDEIRTAIDEVYTSSVEFRQVIPEAEEYRETEAIRRDEDIPSQHEYPARIRVFEEDATRR